MIHHWVIAEQVCSVVLLWFWYVAVLCTNNSHILIFVICYSADEIFYYIYIYCFKKIFISLFVLLWCPENTDVISRWSHTPLIERGDIRAWHHCTGDGGEGVRVCVRARQREGGRSRAIIPALMLVCVSEWVSVCVCDSRQHDSWQIFQVRGN